MRKLKADEIECRVSQVSAKGCSLLLYKTARVDRAILDEEFGAINWQNDFKLIGENMYGGIGIKDPDTKEWIWKWDCGTESNTQAEKGQASDCFKRAGFKWGIGVELYSAPFIFINTATEIDEYATKKNNKTVYKLVDKYAKFNVSHIAYSANGDINELIIIDDKHNQVYSMNNKSTKKQAPKKVDKDTDMFHFENVSNINTVEELNAYWKQHNKEIKDIEQFKTVCAGRKSYLLSEAS
jgi:hypothetical protein